MATRIAWMSGTQAREALAKIQQKDPPTAGRRWVTFDMAKVMGEVEVAVVKAWDRVRPGDLTALYHVGPGDSILAWYCRMDPEGGQGITAYLELANDGRRPARLWSGCWVRLPDPGCGGLIGYSGYCQALQELATARRTPSWSAAAWVEAKLAEDTSPMAARWARLGQLIATPIPLGPYLVRLHTQIAAGPWRQIAARPMDQARQADISIHSSSVGQIQTINGDTLLALGYQAVSNLHPLRQPGCLAAVWDCVSWAGTGIRG